MVDPIILASSSTIRARLLAQAKLDFEVLPARIDEQTVLSSLQAEGATPRDIADTLAQLKAEKISRRYPEALTIGCDQVLALGSEIFSKPNTPENAIDHLRSLRGQRHQLLSAAVIYQSGEPLWRHVGVVRLFMRDLTDQYIQNYVERNWDSIKHAVGAYKLEEEGVRLFTKVEGDYFHVLGMPLLEILSYLTLRGTLDT